MLMPFHHLLNLSVFYKTEEEPRGATQGPVLLDAGNEDYADVCFE